MASFCPKCGTEIRPEGKFCGACGYKIKGRFQGEKKQPPKGDAALSASPKPSTADQYSKTGTGQEHPRIEEILCPNCNQPNQEGVKYCGHCGVPLKGSPKDLPPVQSAVQRKPRIIIIGFLLGVIVLICISLIGIAWGIGLIDFLFPTITPVP
jgi:predicted amidophosphoribosyltransferase